MKSFFILALFCLATSSCTIYRSPERKDFESDSSTFRVQNLHEVSCSNASLRSKASSSKLITIIQDPHTSENQFLWEYIVDDTSYFESDNLKGAYCAFEKNS